MSDPSILPFTYTRAQSIVLEYLVYVSAPFSVAGSALIIWVILNERESLGKSVYHRILLGMSILDFFNSLGILVFGPWSVPEEAETIPRASGTFTTCEVSGFFLNLLFGTCFYSATLALYFVSIIRFEKKERWFAKWVEPVGHFLAIGYPLTSGTVAIIYDFMNPLDILPGWCWISEFPTNCSNEDHVECIRGGDPKPGMGILVAGPLLFLVVFLMILVCMLLIYFKVRETERRMEQYTGNEDRGYERTKEVGRQAILYIAAFLLTYMPIAGTMFCRKSHAAAFVFAVMVKTLSTLQGFFNSIIFLRNQYRTLTSQGQSLYFLRRLAQMTPQQRSFKPSATGAATKHSDVPVTSNQTLQSHKTVKETEPVVFSDRVGSESEQPFWRIKPEQAESSTGPPETLQSDA